MDKKCSYCWGRLKLLENFIRLNCQHQICKNCLLFIINRRIKQCPLCNLKIPNKIFNENTNSAPVRDLSIISSKNQELISNQVNFYKFISKRFLSITRPYLLLNKLCNSESSFALFPNKKSLEISDIVLNLKAIKDFEILEINRLNISQLIASCNFSKNTRRSFLKILFSKILFQQSEKNILWLGTKLRNLGDLDGSLTTKITNDGNVGLRLYSIGFGIDFAMPNTFYSNKIFFKLSKKHWAVDGTELEKDQTNFFFAVNRLDVEIKPNETLKIALQVGNGYYLAVKDQQVHYYKSCPIITTNYKGHNILSYLKFE